MPVRFISRLLFVLLMLVVRAPADGAFKSGHLLLPVPIPRQTAVMWHQDGRETLTIWNTVEADSRELAWVLPLPAVPEVIQGTDAAAVQTVRMMAAPRVKAPPFHAGDLLWGSLPGCLLVLAAAWLLAARRRNDNVFRRHWMPWLIIGLSVVVLFDQGVRMFGAGESGMSAGEIEILKEQAAGSYDTSVIRGNSVEAVNQWLSGNGFAPFEGRDSGVMEDYLSRKWVFFCARVRKGGNGDREIHPLTVRFPSEKPVYPMRLTESAGTVPLDLYVIGPQACKDPSGRLRQVRRLDMARTSDASTVWWLSQTMDSLRRNRKQAGGANPATESEMTNPFPFVPSGQDVFLDTLISGGRILTHLQATFKPGDDWADIQVEPDHLPVQERQYFTWAGWMDTVQVLTGSPVAVIALLGGLLALAGSLTGRPPGRFWAPFLILALVACFAAGLFAASRHAVIVPAEKVENSANRQQGSAYRVFEDWLRKLAGAGKTSTTPP